MTEAIKRWIFEHCYCFVRAVSGPEFVKEFNKSAEISTLMIKYCLKYFVVYYIQNHRNDNKSMSICYIGKTDYRWRHSYLSFKVLYTDSTTKLFYGGCMHLTFRGYRDTARYCEIISLYVTPAYKTLDFRFKFDSARTVSFSLKIIYFCSFIPHIINRMKLWRFFTVSQQKKCFTVLSENQVVFQIRLSCVKHLQIRWATILSRERHKRKKDVNPDSHITSSPTSRSSSFKEVRCLIFAPSQRKRRGYIEFLLFDVTITKIKKSYSSKI